MLTLTIVNTALIIATCILLIYLLFFAVLFSTSNHQLEELRGKINTVDYCSVSWHPLSACSAMCQGVGDDYPTRSSLTSTISLRLPTCFLPSVSVICPVPSPLFFLLLVHEILHNACSSCPPFPPRLSVTSARKGEELELKLCVGAAAAYT
ncbi:hypothetical protein niasHS_001025 [Heterodera schachtii]|uniref:Uncharacterized protein n=1 Tax=Heterodera schachtii TaxID=97005 RepID=A0ABD2K809_HETSC